MVELAKLGEYYVRVRTKSRCSSCQASLPDIVVLDTEVRLGECCSRICAEVVGLEAGRAYLEGALRVAEDPTVKGNLERGIEEYNDQIAHVRGG